MKDLKEDTYRLFADYHFRDDTSDVKWVDTSGHRNHGWAFNMSINATETIAPKRRITQGSHAFLPVPADWDSRVGTARMTFQPEDSILSSGWDEIETGMLKIRMDYSGEIVLSLTSDQLGLPRLKFEWIGATVGTNEEYMGIENTSWTSADGCVAPISPVSVSLSNRQRLAKSIIRTDNPVGRAALGRRKRGGVVLTRFIGCPYPHPKSAN